MLRLCHIMTADLWAGAEVQVATVSRYLAQQPNVQLSMVLFNDGELARRLRRLGLSVTVIDEGCHGAGAILVRLIRHLREHPADVVHTHRYKDTILGACAARAAGVPCVFRTVHGWSEALSGWEGVKLSVYDSLGRLTLRWLADRIIAVSTQTARRLEESGCDPATVVSLPNGIDLHQVRPARSRDEIRRALGLEPGAPVIGTVGRLAPVKGQTCLLEAARMLLDWQPAARFLIVGDGPQRDHLIGIATRLGIESACCFTGARTDIYDLMSAMDVFVLPSLDEGLPMALLEAMAIGTPVVATSVGGVPDVVADRHTGLLVEPKDGRALARACVELVTDPAWARMLAARARQRVEREFSSERHGRALLTLYRRALAETATSVRDARLWPRTR